MFNIFKKEQVFIQTHSGKRFDIISPKEEDIEIEDIAHALSLMPRFGGHLDKFFSVAQHSILVTDLCQDKNHKKWALLHDASEAYIADIITPLKKSNVFSAYRKIEFNLQNLINEKFGLQGKMPLEIDSADKQAFYIEMSNFYKKWPEKHLLSNNYGLCALNPEFAKEQYLKYFNILFK